MKRFFVVLIFVQTAFAGFTELYVQPTGSNLNAGSTPDDTAPILYTGGNWVSSTGVFTVTGGDPTVDGVQVGDWASVYPDGATTAVFVGRVTARSSSSITLSLTLKSGTPPSNGTGNYNLRIGGAWKGPNGTETFPFNFVEAAQRNISDEPVRVNIKGGLDYNVTVPMAQAKNGAIRWEGYTNAVGDGGFAKFNTASGGVFTIMTISGTGGTWHNIWFNGGGVAAPTTPTNQLVHVTGAATYMYRCRISNAWRSGIKVDGPGSIFEEVEAFQNNMDDADSIGQFQITEESTFIRCRAYNSQPGEDCIGFAFSSNSAEPVTLIDCVAENNAGDGFRGIGQHYSLVFSGCTSSDNGGNGLRLPGDPAATSQILVRDCNFLSNGGWGVSGSNFRSAPRLVNCGFFNNTLGEITGVNPSFIIGKSTYNWSAPVPTPQSVSVQEDGSVAITLSAVDSDGDVISFAVGNGPVHGALSGTPPNLVYTPAANYFGADSFTFTASDSLQSSEAATVSITVEAVNDSPLGQPQTVTTLEDTPIQITLSGSDVEGDTLSFTILDSPTFGVLTGTSPLTYSPNPNANGVDTFSFTVFDGVSISAPATVTINVTEVDDPIIIGDADLGVSVSNGVTEAGVRDALTYTITVVNNGPLDVPNGRLEVRVPSQLRNRVWTCSATGGAVCVSTDPVFIGDEVVVIDEELNVPVGGVVTFTLTAGIEPLSPSGTLTLEATVFVPNVILDPVAANNTALESDPITANTPPVAEGASVSVNEDSSIGIVLSASDADGDALSFSISSAPAHGTVTGAGANLIYTPAPDYFGPDSFAFTADDGIQNSTATVVVTVVGITEPPTASGQALQTDEDTALAIGLTGSDPDGDALTYQIITQPTLGTLSGTAPSLTYTPNPAVSGDDSFTFKVSDGTLESAVATVSIHINAVNDSPIAVSQTIVATEDISSAITLSAADEEGDAVTFAVQEQPLHGIISGTGASLTYIPAPNYFGTDTFTFSASDGNSSSTGTVSINVNPVDDPPTAANVSFITSEDTPLAILLPGNDLDGDVLSYRIIAAPTLGTLSGVAPSLIYTPSADITGDDSVTYAVSDGLTESLPATVLISIEPVNDAPVTGPQTIALDEDSSAEVTLTATDAEGDSLTFAIQQQAAHGVVTGTPPNLTYTPEADYFGDDSFTFSVNDGVNNAVGTINLTVQAINDVPLAGGQTLTAAEDVPLSIVISGSDPDGDALQAYTIVTPPTLGVLSGTGPALTYTPNPNVFGADNFTFIVSDGSLESTPATVAINLQGVNDLPIVAAPIPDQSINGADTSIEIGLASTFTDLETAAGALVLSASSGDPALAQPIINGGNLELLLDGNRAGTTTITVRATDADGGWVEDTFVLTVVRPGVGLSVSNASSTEGASAGLVFTLSLSAPATTPVTVTYATVAGSAVSVADYTPLSGTITFSPGVTTRTVTVATISDPIDEEDETLSLQLGAPVGAILEDGVGIGTIVDNDTASLTVQNITVTEGNSGVTPATFSIVLSVPSTRDVSVSFATANISASAVAGLDYGAQAGTLVFPAGSTTPQTITIDVVGDIADEPTESFSFLLSNAVNATIGRGNARADILDDDAPPLISIDDASLIEGDSGSREMRFTVRLSTASGIRARVNYATANGTAVAGVDYVTRTGTVVFDPGVTEREIIINVTPDNIVESDKSFFVNLNTPSMATIADSQAVGTIIDDD